MGWTAAWVALVAFAPSCGKTDSDDAAASGGAASGGADAGTTSGGVAAGGSSSAGGATGSAGQSSEGGMGDTPGGASGDAGAAGFGPATGGAHAGGSTGSGGSIIVVGSGGGAGITSCTSATTKVESVPPVIEFLIDTSQSMAQKAPNSTIVTKYQATRDALSQSFTEMSDGTGTGLIFYPNVTGTAAQCIARQEAVPIGVLDTSLRQMLLQALEAKVPSGSTPTHDALQYALERLRATTLPGSRNLVLVTDGVPTYALGCAGDGMNVVDSAPLIAETAAALASGIHTFVIGSPGSEEARTTLSRMATAGGTALKGCSDQGPSYCHFDLTTAPDLGAAVSAALKAIHASTQSCSFVLPMPTGGATVDRNLVNVFIDTSGGTQVQIPKSSSPNCTDGWQYTSDQQQIVLCSNTCEAWKADPMSRVGIVLGCRTLEL